MKGTSKIIMASTTLIMVVTLAMVLGLVIVLLAEIFCSFLLRQRQRPKSSLNSITTSITEQDQEQSIVPTLSSFYAQGVLNAPRNFLFPTILSKEKFDVDIQNRNSSQTSPSFVQIQSPPELVHEVPRQCNTSTCTEGFINDPSIMEQVYITNPTYDIETNRVSMVTDTPFETPISSPSRLEIIGSSGEDENCGLSSCSSSPSSVQLTPMKKLPAEACSISLRDARSPGTAGSETISNNSNSSSSGSPCTSPSW